jgi:DNA-binding response OmpR family regulator
MAELRRQFGELPGEDLETPALAEVASWISIYEELGSVLRAVLARANGQADDELRKNLAWVEDRLESWRDRHTALCGVRLDRQDHSLTYAGKTIRLTPREADLLDFMIRHPKRSFTTRQLATLAWQNSRLADAQVRTYVMRLKRRLDEVGLQWVIKVVRNRGYGVSLPGVSAT